MRSGSFRAKVRPSGLLKSDVEANESGLAWIRFFKSMWKDFDTEFGGILKSLRRHKELVECRASLAQYGRYKEDMLELMTKLNKQVEEEKLKKLMAVKEWLAVGQQPEQDHVRFQKTRNDYSRTALWILDHEYVKHWMEADIPTTPLLWMHGIPGAGKISLLDYGAYDSTQVSQLAHMELKKWLFSCYYIA
jgi:hypothetical protein